MSFLSSRDLADAIPLLRKKLITSLSRPPIYGLSLRIEAVKNEKDQEIFILHGKYYVSPFTLLSARYSIDMYGNVEKAQITHVKGGYSWFQLNELLVKQWVAQIRAKKYMAIIKRDLVAAAWHPDRVSKWVEAGIALEDM